LDDRDWLLWLPLDERLEPDCERLLPLFPRPPLLARDSLRPEPERFPLLERELLRRDPCPLLVDVAMALLLMNARKIR
jgi:hypothetical protein